MPTRTGCLLLAALGCAGAGPTARAVAPQAAGPPARAVALPAAGSTASCGLAFKGPWLIDSGSATLSCDDGTKIANAAGGNLGIEADLSGRLTMVDGACRFPLDREGCKLVGKPGAVCREGGTLYVAQELRMAPAAAGSLSLAYALEHPDPEKAAAKCVAATAGTMVRASATPETCALDGRWESSIGSDGKPGPVSLTIAQGRCTLEATGLKAQGRCDGRAGALTIDDDACRPSKPARYALTFSADCGAIELEAQEETCAKRRNAIEYLFLRRK